MLGSTEDAEDVLQEVFVNAYRAMLADEREINLRPWLYRIARNRCLNHLRKPSADAQESMDMVPEVEAASTAEKVHNREEFRQIISDVNKLPETQRSALLLREMDALSYEEIAAAMETTVPSVKSLLVRARISLAEASQARLLTCGEVRVELSEAAEGLRKVSAPVRRHVRECEECADFRSQVRSNEKLLAALFPVPALIAFKGAILSKLGFGGSSAASGAAAGGAAAGGGAAAAGGAASGIGAALGGSGAAERPRWPRRHDRRGDRHQGRRRCRHRRGHHRGRGGRAAEGTPRDDPDRAAGQGSPGRPGRRRTSPASGGVEAALSPQRVGRKPPAGDLLERGRGRPGRPPKKLRPRPSRRRKKSSRPKKSPRRKKRSRSKTPRRAPPSTNRPASPAASKSTARPRRARPPSPAPTTARAP